MRYTVQKKDGDYLHINSYANKRPPFWTRDERDSVIFGNKEEAEKYIKQIGVRATAVPRTIKE